MSLEMCVQQIGPAEQLGKAEERLLNHAYVFYNWDMSIYCHDWKRTVVVGNLGRQDLT